jgi:hypothetical protein
VERDRFGGVCIVEGDGLLVVPVGPVEGLVGRGGDGPVWLYGRVDGGHHEMVQKFSE